HALVFVRRRRSALIEFALDLRRRSVARLLGSLQAIGQRVADSLFLAGTFASQALQIAQQLQLMLSRKLLGCCDFTTRSHALPHRLTNSFARSHPAPASIVESSIADALRRIAD